MNFKLILAAAPVALLVAACAPGTATEDAAGADETPTSAEPSEYERDLNATIEACHAAIAATDDWREMDGGALYELAKDVIRDNPDAITANGAGMNPRNYAATRCARNMGQYANGGEAPAGINAEPAE